MDAPSARGFGHYLRLAAFSPPRFLYQAEAHIIAGGGLGIRMARSLFY
jgi:hypothetical protein